MYQQGPSPLIGSAVEFFKESQVVGWVVWLITKTCSVRRPEHYALHTLHCPNHVKL